MNKRHPSNINDYQIRNLKIMSKLLANDAVDDTILDDLWRNELEYFSILEKLSFLNEKINRDDKTGLLRHKESYLADIISTASRICGHADIYELDIGFVRFDIDNFSQFNNLYGHEVGDRVLSAISEIFIRNSRPTDYIIRFGGEEFDAILQSTDPDGIEIFIKKIFSKIRRLRIDCGREIREKVTVSAGITHRKIELKQKFNRENISKIYKKMQEEADHALYEAKFLGKNRWKVYSALKEDEYHQIRRKYRKS